MALKMPKLFGEPKAKLATADGTIDVPTTQVRMTPSSSSGYDPLASVSVMEQLRAATAKSVAPWKLPLPTHSITHTWIANDKLVFNNMFTYVGGGFFLDYQDVPPQGIV